MQSDKNVTNEFKKELADLDWQRSFKIVSEYFGGESNIPAAFKEQGIAASAILKKAFPNGIESTLAPGIVEALAMVVQEQHTVDTIDKAVAIEQAKGDTEINTLTQVVEAAKNVNTDGYVPYSFFTGLECRIETLKQKHIDWNKQEASR